MKKNVSIVSIILVLSLLMGCFLSCNNTLNEEKDNNTPSEIVISNDESEKETSNLAVTDDLPDIDFEGYDFRIYLQDESQSKFVYSESETGDIVNDAVYKANQTVKERFNINMSTLYFSDLSKAKSSILAGDDAFDIVSGHDISMGSLSLENVFANLYDVPHLNFDKPWWTKNTIESLTLAKDKMYIFSNYISYWWLGATRVMYVNKNRLADYGYPLPYDDVFNGTWTFDRFIEMTKDVYIDQDGNTTRDDSDFYGFVNSDGAFYCYLESWGMQVTVKDENEILKINQNTEKMTSVLGKLHDLLFVSLGGYQTITGYDATTDMFAKGNAMFIFRELGNATDIFKNTTFDYGILPMPKIEGQSEYYAGYTDRPYAIPVTATNLERTGIIVEAMSAEGYRQVLPAYYEIALKVKYTHDDESVKTLDIITQSAVLDFWYIYGGYSNENMTWVLSDLLKSSNPSVDYASYYEKMTGIQQKRIDKVITALEAME